MTKTRRKWLRKSTHHSNESCIITTVETQSNKGKVNSVGGTLTIKGCGGRHVSIECYIYSATPKILKQQLMTEIATIDTLIDAIELYRADLSKVYTSIEDDNVY